MESAYTLAMVPVMRAGPDVLRMIEMFIGLIKCAPGCRYRIGSRCGMKEKTMICNIGADAQDVPLRLNVYGWNRLPEEV